MLTFVVALVAAFDTGRAATKADMESAIMSEANLTEEKAEPKVDFEVKVAKHEVTKTNTTNTVELAVVPKQAAERLPKDIIRMEQALQAEQTQVADKGMADEEQKYLIFQKSLHFSFL